jgi:hypothetical protein
LINKVESLERPAIAATDEPFSKKAFLWLAGK